MTDRDLTLLDLCSKGIEVARIDKYMYMFQKFGFNLGYRYKISVNGVKSRTCQKYIEECLSRGDIVVSENKLFCTQNGLVLLDKMCLTWTELQKLSGIETKLNSLSTSDLDMLVVIDIIYHDVESEGGVQALVDSRENIEKMVDNVCNAYTPSKFIELVGFMSELERTFK